MSTYASSVTISLGLASTTVKLKSIKQTFKARASALNMACPECPTKVSQFYVGECGHKPEAAHGYTAKETRKGKQVGDTFIIVTAEEQAEVVASQLPKNVVELSVHDAAEVDGHSVQSGTVYWAEPVNEADQFYPVLCHLIAEGTKAFVAVANLQGHEKMVRLVAHNGGFLVAEIARPDELESYSTEVTPTEKYLVMADQLAVAMTESFDIAAYADQRAAKVAALLASKTGETLAEVISIKPTQVDSLEAALTAALAATGKAVAA